MKKTKTRSYADTGKSAFFYEELGVARAHYKLDSVMAAADITQSALAKRMGLTEPGVSRLLDIDRNLTIRKFASIMFHLGQEVDFVTAAIEGAKAVSNARTGYASLRSLPNVGDQSYRTNDLDAVMRDEKMGAA